MRPLQSAQLVHRAALLDSLDVQVGFLYLISHRCQLALAVDVVTVLFANRVVIGIRR